MRNMKETLTDTDNIHAITITSLVVGNADIHVDKEARDEADT